MFDINCCYAVYEKVNSAMHHVFPRSKNNKIVKRRASCCHYQLYPTFLHLFQKPSINLHSAWNYIEENLKKGTITKTIRYDW